LFSLINRGRKIKFSGKLEKYKKFYRTSGNALFSIIKYPVFNTAGIQLRVFVSEIKAYLKA